MNVYQPGYVYRMPDEERGVSYYTVFAAGGHCLFYDFHDRGDATLETVAEQPAFLRLGIGRASIRRANWQKMGRVPVAGEIAEHGLVVTPSMREVIDSRFSGAASTRPATQDEMDTCELAASWDADEHIIRVMRYRFFGERDLMLDYLLTMIRRPISPRPRIQF